MKGQLGQSHTRSSGGQVSHAGQLARPPQTDAHAHAHACHGSISHGGRQSVPVPSKGPGDCSTNLPNRRVLLAAASALMTLGGSSQLQYASAIPLAPLGPVERIGGDKLNLSTEEVLNVLKADLGERMYLVTGDLTEEIFDDNCRFVDPTNDVSGLSKYKKALGLLFDPDYSKVILKDIRLTGPNTIEADYESAGYLRSNFFPWNPRVDPFSAHIVWTVGEDGLIKEQKQTWSISAFEALRETFTPTSGPKRQLL